jgi:MFS transporter, SP family, solute carrier family 2 (myo-inositol transporter), member 13
LRLRFAWNTDQTKHQQQGVISGAMLQIRRVFGLDSSQQEMVVSSTVLAAFFSSLFLGQHMNRKYGRRVSILWAAGIFAAGSVILLGAWNSSTLLLGRIVVGVGIGIASLTTPIYIAEVALPRMRGQLVTINAFMVTFGQFFAGMIDGVFEEVMPQTGWRMMLGLAAIPALAMYFGFLKLPESPRWLAMNGRSAEADVVLRSLRDSDQEAAEELAEILESVAPRSNAIDITVTGDDMKEDTDDLQFQEDDPNDSTVLEYGAVSHPPAHQQHEAESFDAGFVSNFLEMIADKPTRRALVLGCGLMVVQQCSGINTCVVMSLWR